MSVLSQYCSILKNMKLRDYNNFDKNGDWIERTVINRQLVIATVVVIIFVFLLATRFKSLLTCKFLPKIISQKLVGVLPRLDGDKDGIACE